VDHPEAITLKTYRIRADLFFRLNGMFVERSLLGYSLRFDRDGAQVVIRFPSEDDDAMFALDDHAEKLLERDAWRVTRPPPVSKDEVFSELYVVMVSISLRCKANDVDDKVHTIADAIMRDFIEWHRVRGQTWLGLHGQALKRLSFERYLDEDTGKPPSYSVTIDSSEVFDHPSVRALPERLMRRFVSAADEKFLSAIRISLEAGRGPHLADQMLADALYFADRGEPELPRAVLFAAIACELKIKHILLSKASAEKRPLVEALLGNPRDFSMQVAGLFDKALKATLGHSLREENRPLFNLVNKLFESRNKIAHHGQTPDDKLSEYVRAASDVFQWLDRMFA
jgi:hypothetical protein